MAELEDYKVPPILIAHLLFNPPLYRAAYEKSAREIFDESLVDVRARKNEDAHNSPSRHRANQTDELAQKHYQQNREKIKVGGRFEKAAKRSKMCLFVRFRQRSKF